MSVESSPSQGQRGCWAVALIFLGGLIALLSGLCAGASILGGVIDVINGDATMAQALGPITPFLLVGLPFLAGGIALIAWGRRLQRHRHHTATTVTRRSEPEG